MARTGAQHFLERAWLALRIRCAWFFLFAHVATNLLNRHQKVLLAYPKKAPGAHNQVPRPTSFSVDVEVRHTSYLLVCDVVDVEIADVLPTLFEGYIQLA